MDKKMFKIELIIRNEMLEELKDGLNKIGITGMTVFDVQGCGAQKGHKEFYRGVEREIVLIPKTKVEIVVSEVPVDDVIELAEKILKTGKFGDGKIFVTEVSKVVRVRTGERDWDALQN